MSAQQPSPHVVTRTEEIWLEDGIVRCVVLPTPTHTLADAQANSAAVVQLTGGHRMPMLLDTRASRGVDREARVFYTRPAASDEILALAMLIDSQIGRVLGNFFMRVNQPPFPLRLFTDQSDALAWLAAQRDNAGGVR